AAASAERGDEAGERTPAVERERAGAASVPDRAVPLTEPQSGLWYAQRLDPQNPIFNVAHAVEIDGPLDLDAFTSAVNEAADEADALALRIVDTPSGPRQW